MQRNLEEHIPRPLNSEKFTGNKNKILLGEERQILGSQNARERCRKIDVGSSFFLNSLHDVAFSTRDDVVEFVVDLTNLRMETALKKGGLC